MGGGAKGAAQKVVWEPTRRIRNARLKLSGKNPMDIMLDDLQQNTHVQSHKSLGSLEGIIRGQSGGTSVPLRMAGAGARNGRGLKVTGTSEQAGAAGLQAPTLSVSDQAECLIDMATDPNILGRQWIGLQTWI